MGGRGERFSKDGFLVPKPLIEVCNRPLFYWSTQSICKFVHPDSLTFVVLKEHVETFHIDEEIKKYYPNCRIVIIPEVLPGAVFTCKAGVEDINDDGLLIFNDCDHMFKSEELNEFLLDNNHAFDGGLVYFESNMPQFSYVNFDHNGNAVGTVEKQVVSNTAICGVYLFKNKKLFNTLASSYLKSCSYSEFYMSGLYNELHKIGGKTLLFRCDFHVSFGTPKELDIGKLSAHFEDLL